MGYVPRAFFMQPLPPSAVISWLFSIAASQCCSPKKWFCSSSRGTHASPGCGRRVSRVPAGGQEEAGGSRCLAGAATAILCLWALQGPAEGVRGSHACLASRLAAVLLVSADGVGFVKGRWGFGAEVVCYRDDDVLSSALLGAMSAQVK